MSKGFKKFLLLIIIGLLFTISSCVLEGNSGVNNPSEVDPSIVTYPVYEKNFYASSIEELNNKISSENSLYTTELKFYYNKAFLEKYNFTLTPDFTALHNYYEDFDYWFTAGGIKSFCRRSFTYSEYDKLSTPNEVLYQFEEDEYTIARRYYYGFGVYPMGRNPNISGGGYGITYKARTIYPLYQNESIIYSNLISRKETDKVDLCPNYLVPSIEEYDQKLPNGKYQIPVVPTEVNFEYIIMYGRIYIDNYPIDCMICIQNCQYLNSLESLQEKFDRLSKTNDETPFVDRASESRMFDKRYNDEYYYDYSLHWIEKDIKGPNDVVGEFSYYISFFRTETENNTEYIREFDEIYDEYYSTFAEGASEITINYVNHNQ